MKAKHIIIVLIAVLMVKPVLAQNGASLGIGGCTAISRGVDAVYWNPSNLAFLEENRPNFQMIIYSLSAGTGNNSLSFNSINQYIGDGESKFLDDNDKNNIMDMIPEKGLIFDMNGSFSLLSFSYKNYGFGIETRAFGKFSIPRDLYENIFFKLGHDDYDYSVEGGGYGLTKFKFSYGRELIDNIIFDVPLLKSTIFEKISGGIAISYLQGFGYANVEKGMARLMINDSGILPRAEFQAKYASLGSGIGMDMGFSAYTDNNWKVGMVFENILGSIRWNKDAEYMTASIDFGDEPMFIFGDNQLSEIETDSVSSDTSYAIDGFTKRVPFNFRLGIAKEIKRYLINFEFGHEDNVTSASLGGRIKYNFFNWYASIGRRLGNFQWNTAFSLDFKNYYFDIGISSRGGLTLGHSKALFIGSSMRIGF